MDTPDTRHEMDRPEPLPAGGEPHDDLVTPPSPRARRTRPVVMALAALGAVGLVATGVVLALQLADNSADHVTTPRSQPTDEVVVAEPSPAAGAPSRAQTASAIKWAAAASKRAAPATMRYVTSDSDDSSPAGEPPSVPPSVRAEPGEVYTYTITVSESDGPLPADAQPQDSPLARMMLAAQQRSTCRGTADGVTVKGAEAGSDQDAAATPQYIWITCPDGSRERATVAPTGDIVRVTATPSELMLVTVEKDLKVELDDTTAKLEELEATVTDQ